VGVWVDEFILLVAEQHVELIEKTTASQAATLIAMATISIGDTLSDAVVTVASFFTLPHFVAVAQACLFGFALLAQATLSLRNCWSGLERLCTLARRAQADPRGA
jgi:hypothetical protein